MKFILLYCENLINIKHILNNIYIDEVMADILGEEYNELYSIFQNYYTKEFIANKIFHITYEIIIFNIIELVLNKSKTNLFIKLYNEGLDLTNLITIDNRILDNFIPSILTNIEKEHVYNLLIKIIHRYLSILNKIEVNYDVRYKTLYEDIIEIYTSFYEQLYSELDIVNFRIEIINNTTVMLISY